MRAFSVLVLETQEGTIPPHIYGKRKLGPFKGPVVFVLLFAQSKLRVVPKVH